MKKILFSTLIVIMASLMLVAPVFADSKCVKTSIIGNHKCDEDNNDLGEYDGSSALGGTESLCICDDGQGSSVKYILHLVLDIMSVGVGILGVVGITVVGIQYLTAGGNEEKTRKAKRRMFEIVIGVVIFVLINAILNWLLPYRNSSVPGASGGSSTTHTSGSGATHGGGSF